MEFVINCSITVKTENPGEEKTFSLHQKYTGDPKKLAFDQIIDGWFIENKIDKSKLVSVNLSGYNDSAMDCLRY